MTTAMKIIKAGKHLGRTATKSFWKTVLYIVLFSPITIVHASRINAESQHEAAVQASMQVLDNFMRAFNNKDMNGWGATLNFPHVRFASGEVRVWQTTEEFSTNPPFEALNKIGWDHSHWLSRKVVMASSDKVHIATVFQRFDSNNQSIGTYESLYIVTRVNGRWGIQSRSSSAP